MNSNLPAPVEWWSWNVRLRVAAGVPPAVEPWRLARRSPRAESERALKLVAGSGRQDAALYGRRDACRYRQIGDAPAIVSGQWTGRGRSLRSIARATFQPCPERASLASSNQAANMRFCVTPFRQQSQSAKCHPLFDNKPKAGLSVWGSDSRSS